MTPLTCASRLVLLVVVVGAVACGSRRAPESTAVVPTQPEAPGTCEVVSSDTLARATVEQATASEGASQIAEWAKANPEQATQLWTSLQRKTEETIQEVRDQLARLEQTMDQRCQGAGDPASVSRSQAGTAVLDGRLLLPSGLLPLAGAHVELQRASGTVAASLRAGACGRFRFEGLAAGAYTLRFSTKSFGGSYAVQLDATASATVTTDFRVQPATLRLAVVRGHYDAVEVLLAALGIPFDRLSPACLGSPQLTRYQLVFVNCRHPGILRTETIANLRTYVAGGGSMYFSDLTLPYAEQAWPQRIEPSGEGGRTGSRAAHVDDAELRAFLGNRDRVDLRFNLAGWRRLATARPGMRVLLTDAQHADRPYMILATVDRGLVGFTSFHYTAQPLDDMVLSLVYFVTRL